MPSREPTTTTEILWHIESLEPEQVSVVRIASTIEHLAGPFNSIGAAKRWIANHHNQGDLFADNDLTLFDEPAA